jgi:hypothetical protein
MSITFSSAYIAATSAPNANTDWLLVIDPDGTPIRLSSGDHTVTSNLYHGIVADWGDIDESIDLVKMKLKTGDMSIKVVDTWHNTEDRLSAELYSSAGPHYLNKLVRIYGWSPALSLADSPTLYEGYLRAADLDGKYITLSIESRKQWDMVEAPNVFTENGVYVPLIMGAYSMPTSTAASPALCNTDITGVWKAPVVEVAGGNIRALLHEDADDQANEWIAGVFQESFNLIYPVATTTAGTAFDNDEYLYLAIDGTDYYVGHAAYPLRHSFLSAQLSEHVDNEFTTFENIGTTASSYAEKTQGGTQATGGSTGSAWGNIVKPNYWWKEQTDNPEYRLKVRIEENTGNILNAGNWELRVQVKINGAVLFDLKPAGGGGSWIDPYSESFPYEETFTFDTDGFVEGEDTNIIEIACTVHEVSAEVGEVLSYDFMLNSYRCEYHVQSVETTDTEEELKNANDIKELYFGGDGISSTYNGGSGEPTMAHEMLRELLHRYVDIDRTDGNITGWSDLDGDRAADDWNCRVQEYKPKSMQHYVDALQLHGAFIWQEPGDPTGKSRVIYVKDSYDSGDVDHALVGSDLDGLKVKLTPMSDVISKTIWRYKRHPATGDYLVDYPAANGNRANWGYATDENVATTELEYFAVSPTDIALAYDNIYGEPKIIVDATLDAPEFMDVEVGDIVTFSSMDYEPYGYAWSGQYYMIVKTLRSKHAVKITAREVG